MFSRAAILAVAFTWVAASGVHAESRPQLVWERGPGAADCIDQEALRSAVDAKRETPTFAAQSARQIRGSIEQGGDGSWTLEVASFEGTKELGRRVVRERATECSAITPAIVLIVSLATESSFPAEPKAPLQPPSPRPKATARPKAKAVISIAQPPTPPSSPWQFAIGAEAFAQVGRLPGAAPALGLWADARPSPKHAFGLGIRLWPHARKESPDGDLRLRAVSLSPHYCHLLRDWKGCARAELGIVQARGEGFSNDRSQNAWVGSIGLDLGRRIAIGTWQAHLTPSLIADVPLVRPAFRYEVTQLGEQLLLYQGAPISLGAKLSIEYHF